LNRCPRAVSDKLYIHSRFLKVSPARTVEATKHPNGLAQKVFLSPPLSTGCKRQPAEVTPHTQHTGDGEGDVAALSSQCKFAIRDCVFQA
jgi:hypothetical protein